MLRAPAFRSLAAKALRSVSSARNASTLRQVLRASSAGSSGDFSRTALAAAAVVAAAGVAISASSRAEGKSDQDSVFVNWSASHECRPQQFYVPESVEEIERLLQEYHGKKQKLRCMGAGVSPNGLGFSGKVSGQNDKKGAANEALMTMALFDKILDVNKEKLQVTVEAGIIVGELLDKLRTYGMTMQNVASIRDQQIGGICQAGCHGSGAGIPPIDDQIVEMEIVTPAKGKMTLSATENPDLFALAKCGLGALGVVTKVTLQCVPMHRLAEKTMVMTIDEIRPHHTKWLKEFQHLRYMWIPYTDCVVVVQCRRMNDSEPADDKLYPPVQHSMDVRLEAPRKLYLELKQGNPEPDYLDWSFTKLRDKLLEINPLDKQHVIRVNESEKQFWKLSEGYRVALSDDIIGFDCGGQQHVEEVSFPCQGTLELDFMEKLLARIDAEDIPAHAPIEQRWTARSTSTMSPSSSSNPNQIFSWVGVILYLPTAEENARRAITKRFHEFYEMYRDFMEPYGATEHWAKIEWPRDPVERQKMRERLNRRYPLDKFKKARDEVDPHHILSNHIVDELCA
ncbi:Galactonolactone dehydrogenase, partial [Globisporangium splendens]